MSLFTSETAIQFRLRKMTQSLHSIIANPFFSLYFSPTKLMILREMAKENPEKVGRTMYTHQLRLDSRQTFRHPLYLSVKPIAGPAPMVSNASSTVPRLYLEIDGQPHLTTIRFFNFISHL